MSKLLRIAPLVIVLAATASSFAEESEVDARIVGYKDSKAQIQSSTAAAWFIFAALGLVVMGPLFLNANRTHLD